MAIQRELIRSIRKLDEYDLRRLMIFIRGLLLHREGPAFEPGAALSQNKVTYRLEHVRCGKRGCTRCPHGPYWYAYWREGGRLRSRYIGKTLPEGAEPDGVSGNR
ncbi:MAG: hypothetical protein WDA27_09655 [Actinomycetota bacterium]